MFHKPIQFNRLGLSFPHKTCFQDFSTQLNHGSRIAIIGRNGSGKSSLLKILAGMIEPDEGEIIKPKELVTSYVPQIITDHDNLSGGQRLNEALTEALSLQPDLLLLDEPTNHLDASNRKSLMRMLRNYHGTLLVVSHDVELLRHTVDILWHIDEGRVKIFHGNYDDYLREREVSLNARADKINNLQKEQKKAKSAMLAEQERTAKSKKANKNEKDKFELRKMRDSGDVSSGKIKSRLNKIDENIQQELQDFRMPEVIKPKFSFEAGTGGNRNLISIVGANIGYDEIVLYDVNLSLNAEERIALQGDNASGKSTLIKAILNKPEVIKSGNWQITKSGDIGYLDQHYNTLDNAMTVYETIKILQPDWTQSEIRQHLGEFIFRKNEEVNASVATLSGGEKVRLCLAQIAAKTPRLLILDEITNNLDLETREYVVQVLEEYPGALIVISHDQDFLNRIKVDDFYECKDGFVMWV